MIVEIEYIRVSAQCGIRIFADGPYDTESMKAVRDRIIEGLDRNAYEDSDQEKSVAKPET